MNITAYVPDALHQRAKELHIIGPDATERGVISRILREGLEFEVDQAETEVRRQAVASHAV